MEVDRSLARAAVGRNCSPEVQHSLENLLVGREVLPFLGGHFLS